MKTSLRRATIGALVLATAAALTACGGATAFNVPSDAGTGSDTGSGVDSGGGTTDSGGGGVDSGTGSMDSGGGKPADSGSPGTDAGSPMDSGITPTDAGGPTPCPSTPPMQGEACMPNGVECEYGTNPTPACNQVFECTAGAWTKQVSVGGCPVGGTCPSSYASVPINQDCQPENLTCGYAQGTCICSLGSLPRVGGPAWTCFPEQTGCPSPRPNYGTPCSDEGQTCDYGACNGGEQLECTGGTWQNDPMVACPAVR